VERLILIYLLLVNGLAFFAMGLDKWKARREGMRRIPEKTLLGLAIVGGSVGAFCGMRLFHHKTRHNRFRYGLPLILIAHLALAGWLLLR